MTWLIVALLGLPLWLCAIALIVLVLRKRSPRRHSSGIAVRARREPGKRWASGRVTWINDMLIVGARPKLFRERVVRVTGGQARIASAEEVRALGRVAADPIVVVLDLADGTRIEAATPPHRAQSLLGPYAAQLDLAPDFAPA